MEGGARGAKAARLRQGYASEIPAATSYDEVKRRRGAPPLSTVPNSLSKTVSDGIHVAEPKSGNYIEKRFRTTGASSRWFRGKLLRRVSRSSSSLWEVVELII